MSKVSERSVHSNTAELKSLAMDLINGQDVSSLEPEEYQAALLGLNAVRHQAMINNNRKRQKRADYLISEITMLKNRPRPKPSQNAAKWTPRTVRLKQAQPVPNSSGPIVLSDTEKVTMNGIVDSLLDGNEIDTIDSAAIPKLYHVLKERKQKAIDEGEYEDAKVIDHNLMLLLRFQSMAIASQPAGAGEAQQAEQRIQEMVSECENALKRAQKRLGRLQSDLERDEAEIGEMKEESQSRMFSSVERMVTQLEQEKDEMEMGLGFRKSKRLLELRETEARLAKNSLFDEAAVARKTADLREAQERREFDMQRKKALKRREARFNKENASKIQCTNEFWEQKLAKIRQNANYNIEQVKREINALKERIAKLTGKPYDEAKSAAAPSEGTEVVEVEQHEEEENQKEPVTETNPTEELIAESPKEEEEAEAELVTPEEEETHNEQEPEAESPTEEVQDEKEPEAESPKEEETHNEKEPEVESPKEEEAQNEKEPEAELPKEEVPDEKEPEVEPLKDEEVKDEAETEVNPPKEEEAEAEAPKEEETPIAAPKEEETQKEPESDPSAEEETQSEVLTDENADGSASEQGTESETPPSEEKSESQKEEIQEAIDVEADA